MAFQINGFDMAGVDDSPRDRVWCRSGFDVSVVAESGNLQLNRFIVNVYGEWPLTAVTEIRLNGNTIPAVVPRNMHRP